MCGFSEDGVYWMRWLYRQLSVWYIWVKDPLTEMIFDIVSKMVSDNKQILRSVDRYPNLGYTAIYCNSWVWWMCDMCVSCAFCVSDLEYHLYRWMIHRGKMYLTYELNISQHNDKICADIANNIHIYRYHTYIYLCAHINASILISESVYTHRICVYPPDTAALWGV